MAIYEPPKQTAAGGILKSSGQAAMSIGGTLAATGAGAVPGAIVAAVGGVASLVGGIIEGKQNERNENYQAAYQNQLTAENNLAIQKYNTEQAMMLATQAGINSSVKAINNYITPSGGGTGIINQRLV